MSRSPRVLVLGLAFAHGCSCGRTEGGPAMLAPPPSRVASESASPGGDASHHVVLDMVGSPDACVFGHDGVLVDFGEPSSAADLHPGWVRTPQDEVVEREGATWLRVRSRTLGATFYWPAVAGDEPDASLYAEARIRGGAAHAVAVAIDGKNVGTWSLVKGEIRVVAARSSGAVPAEPGGHDITLRFIGGGRANDDPLAEIDWIHVGAGEPSDSYAAPTRRDVVIDATFGGNPKRALSLRAPGFVRCSGWIPSNATVDVSLATTGPGDADVEARLVRDRRAPVVLGQATVAPGGGAWIPWSVPVAGVEGDGALASIELSVKRATKGARVLLGGARVVASGPSVRASVPRARSVILVVLGSTSRRSLGPFGGPHPVPELASLAATGTTFLAHRASSSLANAAVASMLTGLSPLADGLDDADARLSDGVTTVEEACREGSIATAMFTANPTTSSAFGFARAWDTFVAHDPLEDVPATRVFDDAAEWIDAHRSDRFFVVVHARGGHPPWDATPDELKAMPPDGYLGMIEPRRAAEALAKVRKHPARFKEDDRARAWALYDRAVDAQDAALGRLTTALRNAGRADDTALIVTADVAANDAASVPFCDPDTLDEPVLAIPLVARWPQSPALSGKRVAAASGSVDVARSVLDALGLAPPAAFEGVDLAALAEGEVTPDQRPMLATRASRFSARWGPYVLLGGHDREQKMCDLTLDPSCVADVRGTSPLALEPLRRWTIAALASEPAGAPPRVPVVLDDRTLAGLVRWGHPSKHERGEE